MITQRIDEAESICDSIALMINGEIQDMGDPTYLKAKHGDGYILKVDLFNKNDSSTN